MSKLLETSISPAARDQNPLWILRHLFEEVDNLCNSAFKAQCPRHSVRSQCLSVQFSEDGQLMIECRRGCKPAEIIQHLGFHSETTFLSDLLGWWNYSDMPKPKASRLTQSIAAFYGRQ